MKLGGKPESYNMDTACSIILRISDSHGFALCVYGANDQLPIIFSSFTLLSSPSIYDLSLSVIKNSVLQIILPLAFFTVL